MYKDFFSDNFFYNSSRLKTVIHVTLVMYGNEVKACSNDLNVSFFEI